jgi:hypothetical protein
MPFISQGRIYGLQAVIITHSPPCTIRTPSASVPVGNSGFPFMAFGANPPHSFV